jgi:hypothetical protein
VPECECDKTLERLPPGINPPSLAACDSMACFAAHTPGDNEQPVRHQSSARALAAAVIVEA